MAERLEQFALKMNKLPFVSISVSLVTFSTIFHMSPVILRVTRNSCLGKAAISQPLNDPHIVHECVCECGCVLKLTGGGDCMGSLVSQETTSL